MVDLTIPNEVVEIEYSVGAVASSGPFTIPFNYFQNADVRVSVNDGTTTTDLTLITDYTIGGASVLEGGLDGGEVTLVVPVTNSTVKVYRSVVIERLTNFPQTGPFDINSLNDELNKQIAIDQELASLSNKYLSVGVDAVSTDPFSTSDRPIVDVGESALDDSAVTVRQLNASGPNGVADDNLETGPLTNDQWNTLITISNVQIEGAETTTTKLFDLITQFHTLLQNRGSLEAEVYIRYRYIVDCYSEITKQSNANYRLKIPATSMVPLPFMDIEQDIDYFNGNGTLFAAIDIYPQGVASNNIYTQWNNISITTMQPR